MRRPGLLRRRRALPRRWDGTDQAHPATLAAVMTTLDRRLRGLRTPLFDAVPRTPASGVVHEWPEDVAP